MTEVVRVSANGASPTPPATEANPRNMPIAQDLPDIAQEFLKEEHKQRRLEISSVGARMEADNRNVLILTGAIWSWLATNHATLAGQGYFVHVVVFMPAALVAFFFYRWRWMHRSIHKNAEYLRELEANVGVEKFGWENWLQQKRVNDPTAGSLARAGRTFWILLVITNILLAVLFGASQGWFGR